MKILIVDDIEQNLYMLKILLEGFGYEVVSATNGAEALEKARREPPEMIITDILMPVMDGFTLCREWKKDEQLKYIPFIFYTATYTDPKDEELALSLGADRFIVKPTEPDDFIKIVQDVIKDVEEREIVPKEPTLKEDKDVFKLYSERLVIKLEKKMLDLEKEIAERKRAEKALRESEEKYRNIFENVSDFLYLHDLEGNFIETNYSFKKEYGFSEDEIIHLNIKDIMPEKYKLKFDDYMKRVKENGKDEGLISITTKDGRELIIEYRNSLFFDSKGIPIGVRGSGRDITERIQAKKEKKKLEAQLQQAQKMEAMGTLAGGIAHDFNNLLTGIQGRTSLMIMDTDSSHPHFEHFIGIQDYVKSATDLTKQLLGFARGGKYKVRTIDLNEFIKKQNRMFGRARKEIAIKEKYEEDLWTVEVDQGQIEQVLLNIYVNAWQAMPGGGDLYIQTENVIIDENYIKPYKVEPGKYVKISVTDTGIGMDKSTQQRIFEPFFTTREMGRGTGLGLASAYGIIKNHDGFIDVYSEKGEDTTFNIYLPASEKEIIDEKELAVDILKGSETVLLVDDEDMIIDVGQDILKSLGYEVLPVRGGEEAVEVYKKNHDKIDMVILDMIMPDMGGRETYDRLKEINPDIKVLLSSGYSIDGQATEILERGCDDFIQKPFNITDLSQKIRKIFDKD